MISPLRTIQLAATGTTRAPAPPNGHIEIYSIYWIYVPNNASTPTTIRVVAYEYGDTGGAVDILYLENDPAVAVPPQYGFVPFDPPLALPRNVPLSIFITQPSGSKCDCGITYREVYDE